MRFVKFLLLFVAFAIFVTGGYFILDEIVSASLTNVEPQVLSYKFNGSKIVSYYGDDVDVVLPSSYSIKEENIVSGDFAFDSDFSTYRQSCLDFLNFDEELPIPLPIDIVYADGHLQSFYDLTSLAHVFSFNSRDYEQNRDLMLFKFPVSYSYNNSIYITGNDFEVTSFEENVFKNNKNIVSIVFPDSISELPNYAFYECSSLTSVTLPNNLDVLPDYVFSGCSSLTNINLPSSLNELGDYCFNRTGFVSFDIPNSVNILGQYVFSASPNLTEVKIPEHISTIPCGFLNNCDSLTSYIVPSHINKIENYAFAGCDNLKIIELNDSISELGLSCFSSSAIENIIIPNSLSAIPSSLFRSCKNLSSVTLPKNIVSIDSYAFADCESLSNITLSDNIVSIGNNAFQGCINLTSISIPALVTELGENVFYDCSKLEKVVFNGSHIYSNYFSSLTFSNLPDTVVYYVLDSLYLNYTMRYRRYNFKRLSALN